MNTQLLMVSASALVLVACGGGGGGGNSGNPPPSGPTNAAPVAVAGTDFSQSASPNGAGFDGSGSSDPDGDTLSFSWAVTGQPVGASATFDDSTLAQPTLSSLVPGDYIVELTVNDGRGGSDTDTVTATLTNDAPIVAVAAVQSEIGIGLPLGLDASGSSDANGHSLTYEWVVTSAPSGSNLRRSFTGPSPLVELDVAGSFEFRLDVTDGYETSSQTLNFTAANFTSSTIQDGFDFIEVAGSGSLAAPTSRRELGLTAENTSGGSAVSASGSTVRVVGNDGTTLRSYDLPQPVIELAVSPNGGWVAASHLDSVSIISLTANEISGTWPVSTRPGDLIIGNDGFAHAFPATGQWVRVESIDPATGAITTHAGSSVRQGTRVQIHPSGTKAYGADNGLSPSDIERYDLTGGALTLAYDSPYHGDYPFCGNLWIASSGTQILSACGVVTRATDDRSTDLTFRTQIARVGTIVDAAYDSLTNDWYVIETRNGTNELNIYDADSGVWKRRLDMPEVSAGREAVPLKVVTDPNSGNLTFFASDHPTNPLAFGMYVGAAVDQSVLNFAPVAVVLNGVSGYLQDEITLDASRSYDPEGESLSFTWTLVSEPADSAISIGATDASTLSFTPSHEGEYVFSLVVNDGERESAQETISVQAVSQGTALQVRLLGTPSDVVYNKVTNQILYTIADDQELRIVNLDGFSEQVVPLDRGGYTVDVSPDGRWAAVSHVGMASLIDLGGASASVADTQEINADWGDIVVDDRAVAYTIPRRDQWVEFLAIDFSTDFVGERWGARAGTQLRMRPSGGAVYGANRGVSPSDIERYTVTDITSINKYDSPYHGNYSMAGNLWFSETSERILVAGGHVFRSTDVPQQDMLFVETLSPATGVTWADHSEEAGRWAVVSGNQLQLYTDDTYLGTETVQIEQLFFDPAGATPNLDRAFYSDDGSQLIVVAHSTTASENAYVVQIIE